MKTTACCVAGFCILATHAAAQRDVPPPPGVKIKPAGGQGGIEVLPKAPPIIKYTTHIVLSNNRTWTSTDGKPLEAKLLAFEDLVVEAPEGATPPEPPATPQHPTVVRGDKVRLLVNRKPVEVPLSRLSQTDRDSQGI